ncbi:MAG: response regulator [Planctomycetes bacterium]|nr:response regulator [Planctomycetota bacterium]
MNKSRIAPPLKVLIADPGALFKRSAAEALAEKGFSVDLADSAEETFERVRVFEPNIVFYDLDLPGYDGIEAVTLIAKTRPLKEGYIIACSVHAGAGLAGGVREAGAWDFMRKPIDVESLLDVVQVLKRHIRRPRDLPREAANSSLKVALGRCPRPGCNAPVAAFGLKPGAMVTKDDQFETLHYLKAARKHEFVDYNLLSVTVCPRCYFAWDKTLKLPQNPLPAGPSICRGASAPVLFRIAAEADDTLFTEGRTSAAALIALGLAVENHRASAAGESVEGQGILADLLFKAAAVAHGAGDDRQRDRFLADAEEVCVAMTGLAGCAEVYRAAYQLTAIYVFFARDVDAARTLKAFERLARPEKGRLKPRDSRVLEKYRAAAARLLAQRNRYRRADYFPR